MEEGFWTGLITDMEDESEVDEEVEIERPSVNGILSVTVLLCITSNLHTLPTTSHTVMSFKSLACFVILLQDTALRS